MCFSSTPDTPAPVKAQDAKMPEQSADGSAVDGSMSDARKKMLQSGGAAASTLLTGPSGVETNSLNIGKSTLLGA